MVDIWPPVLKTADFCNTITIVYLYLSIRKLSTLCRLYDPYYIPSKS